MMPWWLNELYGDAVRVSQIGDLAARVGTLVDRRGVRDRSDFVAPCRSDGSADVVHIEGHVGEADVARSRHDAAPVLRPEILDEFEVMPGPPNIRNHDMGSLDPGHLRNDLRIAGSLGDDLEVEGVPEEGDGALQVGYCETGVIRVQHFEAGHARKPPLEDAFTTFLAHIPRSPQLKF